jgi:dTMP kinase
VRKILLSNAHIVHPLSELLLYEAARAQHTEDVLLPALRRGSVVISERYTLASLAYQGFGRRLGLPLVRQLNRIAASGLQPDLTLVLDIPESCLKTRDPSRKLDRLEKESLAFHRRVRRAYRRLSRSEPKTRLIDADRPGADVHRDILRLIEPLF